MLVFIFWDKVIFGFKDMYASFNMELPFFTKIIFSRAFYVISVLILIAKEFYEQKRIVLLINILFPVAVFIVIPILFVIGLFLPIFQLSNAAK